MWETGESESACALSVGEAHYQWVCEQCNNSRSLILKWWIYIRLLPKTNLSDPFGEIGLLPSLAMWGHQAGESVVHLTFPSSSPEGALLFFFFFLQELLLKGRSLPPSSGPFCFWSVMTDAKVEKISSCLSTRPLKKIQNKNQHRSNRNQVGSCLFPQARAWLP